MARTEISKLLWERREEEKKERVDQDIGTM